MGHTDRQLTVDSGQWTAGEEALARVLCSAYSHETKWEQWPRMAQDGFRAEARAAINFFEQQQAADVPDTWREKWGRAVRLVTRMGSVEKELRAELAAIKEGEILALKKERAGLQEALRSTTVNLNRYFEELTKLRGEKNLTTDCTDSTDREGTQRREGAKVGRPLPSGDVLAQVFWQGFESSRKPDCRVAYGELDPETRRHQEEGIQCVLDALGPHLRPADETAETLRGRLRQVMASVDQEKAGRLRAETRVQELEAALTSARADHGERLHEQAGRYEVKLSDLRSNHQNEIAGLQGMLAEMERRIQLTVDSGQLTAGEDKKGAEMDGAA